jgi:hypothetical protein
MTSILPFRGNNFQAQTKDPKTKDPKTDLHKTKNPQLEPPRAYANDPRPYLPRR